MGSYRVTIPVNAKQYRQFCRRKLLASNNNMVPPNSKKMIFFAPVSLPDNCNFIFHPTIQANLILYTHIINYTTTKILVSNTSDCPLCIPQHQKLSHIVNICYENCLLADAQVTFDSAAFPLRTQLFLVCMLELHQLRQICL